MPGAEHAFHIFRAILHQERQSIALLHAEPTAKAPGNSGNAIRHLDHSCGLSLSP